MKVVKGSRRWEAAYIVSLLAGWQRLYQRGRKPPSRRSLEYGKECGPRGSEHRPRGAFSRKMEDVVDVDLAELGTPQRNQVVVDFKLDTQ
jgi:hypothetical protein